MTPARQRCHDVRFKSVYGAVKAYSNSFFQNTIQEWNKLPANIVNSNDLGSFKVVLVKMEWTWLFNFFYFFFVLFLNSLNLNSRLSPSEFLNDTAFSQYVFRCFFIFLIWSKYLKSYFILFSYYYFTLYFISIIIFIRLYLLIFILSY